MPVAIVNGYCSLASLRRETGNSDTDLDDWFSECINMASRWIDDHCYRDFFEHDYAPPAQPYTVLPSDVIADQIFLPWPIKTLTEVKIGDFIADPDRYVFAVGKRSIRLRDGDPWIPKNTTVYPMSPLLRVTYATGGSSTITVAGTFGFAAVPAAVSTACVRIAAAWSQEKRRERVSMDGQRTSLLDQRIPDDALTLLKRFRLLVH